MDRGAWRIYLGAAPGVGTTYAMLDEGRRRAERGRRVVTGWVDTHGRDATAAQLAGLERAPTSEGPTGPELDVGAVIARRAEVCLVDDIAGGAPLPRWRAVEELLAAGIDVVSTLRVEHLESLQDVIDGLLGEEPRPTIPDEGVRRADQIELVDMTPEALRRRLAHGHVLTVDEMDASTADRFRPEVLGALRQLALRWVIGQIDQTDRTPTADGTPPAETHERVAVSITGAPGGDRVIRRAARLAARLGGDLVGIHVRRAGEPDDDTVIDRRTLLEDLGGRYLEVVSADVAEALLSVARSEGTTQLVLGTSRRSRWATLRRGSVINDVLREAGAIDVHLTAGLAAKRDRSALDGPRRRSSPDLPRRRRGWGWAGAVVLPPFLAVALVQLRSEVDLSTVLLSFVATAVACAAVGGTGPGLLAAASGFGLANWYFTPPFRTLTIGEPEHAVSLGLSLVVAAAVGVFVSAAARRSADATRARSEAAALARAAATTVAPDPLAALVGLVRQEVGARSAAILARTPGGWVVEAASGGPIPSVPGPPGVTVPVGDSAALVVDAPHLSPIDLSLLTALASQLTSALTARRLSQDAAAVAALAAANDLRGAILNAASHDLRSPLSGIKAAVSSLLATDVSWDPSTQQEFLETIDQETDRLTGVLTNLLDLSRLEAGALQPMLERVGAAQLVASALASLGLHGDDRVRVEVDEALPDLFGDPGLIERVLANLVQNAMRHAAASPVRVQASAAGDRLVLRVVDQGPGVDRAERDRVFRPFEQAGDQGGPGLGLGLAVSRGLVDAQGGTLSIEDTPGGGCTMVVELPLAPAEKSRTDETARSYRP